MTEFFESLKPIEKVFLISAILGGAIFVVRLILFFIGMGHHGVDAEAGFDGDVGHDVGDMGHDVGSVGRHAKRSYEDVTHLAVVGNHVMSPSISKPIDCLGSLSRLPITHVRLRIVDRQH